MADTKELTSEQVDVLFDILTHHETYNEIEDFKSPEAIKNYGPPFQDSETPDTPILQALLSKFALTLPSLKDITPDFWKKQVQNIIQQLSAAELSESYDKGLLGIRKTLATAISSLLEYPTRAVLGGFPKNEEAFKERSYDKTKPEDVIQAWHDFLQQLVYGDLWDTLFKRASETDDLTKHNELTQAAHEYVVVNLASFMHYTLILSAEGPSLVRLVESVHKLIPYSVVKQTLRVGNVATMISGMMKLLLAKMSVASLTNWVGLSTGADEGMNLLQQIMSTTLGWDKKELKKRIDKIEKSADAPSKEARDALMEWIGASREEHLETRRQSRQQEMSIVYAILSLSPTSPEMSDAQHAKAMEYLSLQLALRDRREIIRILCNNNPDYLTEAIRQLVSAYEPMIRQIHNAVDLSATVGDFQTFMDDMLKLSRPSDKPNSKPPTVEDFVNLLHRHMRCSHRFLHQVCKNGKEVTAWFNDYVHDASAQFRTPSSADSKPLPQAIAAHYSTLSADQQSAVTSELDAYGKYLSNLKSSSRARISDVIRNESASKSNTSYGPGSYLAKWQSLMDQTIITPDKQRGPTRTGGSKSVKAASKKDVDGNLPEGGDKKAQKEDVIEKETLDATETSKTIEEFQSKFQEMLKERK